MQHYPIFVSLKNQPCLVIGGGQVALRKIRLMRSAGAHITVIAPDLCAELITEFSEQINHIQRPFVETDIGDYRLVTAATNSPEVNAQVSQLAQAKNIPVNVVDQPELCSFITPSIIDRSSLIIAISTGGGAPVLASMLRSKLESLIPASYARLADFIAQNRDRVKKVFSTDTDRRRFWHSIIDGPIGEQVLNGNSDLAEQQLQSALKNTDTNMSSGQVWLIGAGPGDPDLLTFRALRLMQQADVVLYDRLVNPEILALCRRDADRVYVGKRRADHSLPQDEINQQLVELAQQGKNVVRLKGGDPFIFGRGGEEIELLAESGIAFQIVPGITAASGCATYAGIPLTHRDHAQSCLFVTGHLKDGTVNLDWQQLATPNQTVVIYMGLVGLPTICDKLIENGVCARTPIALIEQGTTNKQRVFISDLKNINDRIKNTDVHAPTLLIIGSVVKLHDKLNWFSSNTID